MGLEKKFSLPGYMFYGPSTSWLELFIDQQEGYIVVLLNLSPL
jgi:hypothetical protein